MIDDVSIEYEGNRLVKADDTVDGPYGEGLFHFVDGADEEYEYSYDENGNMTKDLNRGIEEIRYNFLNLPSKITFTEKNAYIRNMYDANGHKFKMITYANIPLVIGRAAPAKASAKAIQPGQVADSLLRNNSLGDRLIPSNELPCVAGQTTYDYCGNIVYKNGIPTIYREDGFTTLARMRFPEFHYYIRDHQGNIRGVTDGRGNIEQQNDYYPFGGMMASSTGGAVQPYRYTGKELVRFQGLDWLDYGARWYDPATLRWNGVDKLAEKYTPVSPYTFCLNNPIRYIDPDGKKVYLYATTLPGTNIPFATHTFIVITDNKDNVKKYFAFGSEYDGIKGATGGRLMQRIYNQDIDVYNGNDTEHLKAKIPISTPANMKDEEFENRISEVAESFGNNESITYMFIPIKETQGNCNTSSSTILLKSGLSPKDLENLNKLIPGVVTGFDSYTRPWTKKEQEEAVLRERKVNEIKKEIGGH